ncbi:MAG TPA: hypothetical protein PLP69_01390 [Bacteroidales bacterium]|nr:hypothetical protein [Bacteroidales bacterium]
MRKDDSIKSSLHLSRNIITFTSPMLVLMFLSLISLLRYFSGLKRDSGVAILWRVLSRYMNCTFKTARMGRPLSLHP